MLGTTRMALVFQNGQNEAVGEIAQLSIDRQRLFSGNDGIGLRRCNF